jgi:hypothetical protein
MYTIPSSQENLLTAPPNLTTMFNPGLFWHEPTFYMGPHPIEGLGEIIPFSSYTLGSYVHPWGLRAGATPKGIGQLSFANPIESAIGGGLSIATSIRSLLQPSFSGVMKQNATTVVNAFEPLFRENVSMFQANPTPANQQAAISQFNSLWLGMTQEVSPDSSGGTNAINDRAPGGKVDWWKLYLDPIQNYKFGSSVVSGGSSTSNTASLPNLVGGLMGSPLLLLGVIGIAVWAMSQGGKEWQ